MTDIAPLKLHSIAREAADCRAAWAAAPEATAGAHIHHEQPFEALTEPIENRIAYILSDKPKKEQALRLRLMRPVTAPAWAEYQKARAAARAEYEKAKAAAHAALCPTPGCPWDGRSIFGGAS